MFAIIVHRKGGERFWVSKVPGTGLTAEIKRLQGVSPPEQLKRFGSEDEAQAFARALGTAYDIVETDCVCDHPEADHVSKEYAGGRSILTMCTREGCVCHRFEPA